MNNKDGLDEMQQERHSKIGSQMFVFMAFALLIDISLASFGIRLLDYPSDIMAIVVACSCIYIVRLIMAGAYPQPSMQNKKLTIITLILAVVIAAVFAIALPKLPTSASEPTNDYSAYILIGISFGGLIAVWVASVIKKKRDTDYDDD